MSFIQCVSVFIAKPSHIVVAMVVVSNVFVIVVAIVA